MRIFCTRSVRRLLRALCAAAPILTMATTAAVAESPAPGAPDFGPNVTVFDPAMPIGQIQATVDALAAKQTGNQFGPERYALLFKPGTYGTAAAPLNFQVGFYTAVAGLGRSPGDVVINGSVNVYNQCDNGSCVALDNFWRSLSNLTIQVTNPDAGCRTGEFWAVSQAAPMRRVLVNGLVTLMDYCTGPSFASGGFIADSAFTGNKVINGSQQQWMVRNSNIDSWSNGVWNQVFSGVVGAPANCFPAQAPCGGPYTTLAASPVTREAPYLYLDADGRYRVFVPAVQTNSVGTSWAAGATPGRSIPIRDFYVARPSDSAETINAALESGRNLILTPGVYALRQALRVERPGTVVLGLGFPTLVPQNGNPAMTVEDARGVLLSGLIFDAGPRNSPVLLRVGGARPWHDAHERDDARNDARDDARGRADPAGLYDVFFRIGGATPGSATVSLAVNADNTILDDIWAWRADHGNGVGWTQNTADTGVIVNGRHVTAYGLFVEHYQKYEVIWNGRDGADIFFQNEMPYDPPSQSAWMEAPGVNGWAAFKLRDNATGFRGYGMGSYNFFNQGVTIYAANAFEVPATLAPGSLQDLLTVALNSAAAGGTLNVVNNTGGPATIANPDVPVTVVSYP